MVRCPKFETCQAVGEHGYDIPGATCNDFGCPSVTGESGVPYADDGGIVYGVQEFLSAEWTHPCKGFGGKAVHNEEARAARGVSVSHCALGVGCDEAGVCYAAAHGQPEQCGRPDGVTGTLKEQP